MTGEEQETSTQKYRKKGGWNAAIFIIFVEGAERFAYYGVSGNLIMYLTTHLHQPTAVAAKSVTTWVGVSSVFALLGAIVADCFLGRFRTIILSTTIYFMGMVLLCVSVSIIPSHYRKVVFYIALYILSVGEGGHKPCVQTFAADQFDEDTPEEKEKKSSFFNWWFLAIVIAGTTSTLLIVYIQDNVSWVIGFGMLTVIMALGLVLFLLGIERYRKEGPRGSAFTSVAQVFVAAARKWRLEETLHSNVLYKDEKTIALIGVQSHDRTLARTNQLRFLDKAMLIDTIDASTNIRNPWRLCSQHQIEEVKLVLRLIPIWFSCLMFFVVQSQLHTYFIKQGSTMIRSIGPHFHLPPASLQALVGLVILVTIPIYDRFLVPTLRKITGIPTGITILQRIGIGLFLSILNMSVSALVEAKRVRVARKHDIIDDPNEIVPMYIWWLLPQFILCGLGSPFTVVGLQELFYDQMPDAMRSLGAAAYIGIVGVGSFGSSLVIFAVQGVTSKFGEVWLGDNLNRAHLDDFYWVLAGLSCLSLGAYVGIAMGFVYKKVEPSGE